MQITDWDDAYQNGAYIPGADDLVAGWATRAAAFRAKHFEEVLNYGSGDRQFLDLYRPETAAQGLCVIVHGGYWHKFEGRAFAHLAAGPQAAGYAVANVTYTLAPEARISEITQEIAHAVIAAAKAVPDGPIFLTGHSAGGHLVSRMGCPGVLPDPVADRIAHILSISGVHDLRPLLRTAMNDTLRLDAEEAAAESPALLTPRPGLRLTCAVGSEERPEFLRQNDLLANIWTGMGVDTQAVHLPGDNHFTIIAGLESPDGTLTRLLLDQS
ncbi:alpha/beta hydrolase fold domain-containing protein [Roseibacterium beibuensis]|uniref:Alpha/beta hydrolase n=1 Tax=[Roseibacterium] beibuensis TaxID=1193142 RepID=A0ABP9LHN0_9RHOB|nr:alpha/beta fold hydrolase [Roseibacterium beibuensis]MCS6623055.1 alpha/beta hydrolase fold domain-containing protein [Roseibacterium beibuensis]